MFCILATIIVSMNEVITLYFLYNLKQKVEWLCIGMDWKVVFSRWRLSLAISLCTDCIQAVLNKLLWWSTIILEQLWDIYILNIPFAMWQLLSWRLYQIHHICVHYACYTNYYCIHGFCDIMGWPDAIQMCVQPVGTALQKGTLSYCIQRSTHQNRHMIFWSNN